MHLPFHCHHSPPDSHTRPHSTLHHTGHSYPHLHTHSHSRPRPRLTSLSSCLGDCGATSFGAASAGLERQGPLHVAGLHVVGVARGKAALCITFISIHACPARVRVCLSHIRRLSGWGVYELAHSRCGSPRWIRYR